MKLSGMVRGVVTLAVVAGLMPFGASGAFANEAALAGAANDGAVGRPAAVGDAPASDLVASKTVAGKAADEATGSEAAGQTASTVNVTVDQGPAAVAANEVAKAAATLATTDGEVHGTGWKLDANGVFTLTADVADRDEGLGQGPYEWDAYKERIKEVKVAEGVTRIPVTAFSDYPNLQKATMSSTVKQIMGGAFHGCERLTEAILNDGLEMVSVGAFSSSGLTSIKLPSGVEWYSDVFTDCKNLSGALVVPKDFTSRGNTQFYGTNLEVVIFEEGFGEVPLQLLNGCKNLKYVYAPKTLTVRQGTLDDGTVYFEDPIPACTIIGYKGSGAEKYVEHWLNVGSDWAAGMNFHAIDGDEHAYGAWTIVEPAGCETAGVQKRTCEICGAEETKAVSEPAGHAWDEGMVTKEPTVDAEGVKEFHCDRCGTTKTEVIAKLPATPAPAPETDKPETDKPENDKPENDTLPQGDAPAAKPENGTLPQDGDSATRPAGEKTPVAKDVLPQTGDPAMALAGMAALASAGTFAATLHLKKRK